MTTCPICGEGTQTATLHGGYTTVLDESGETEHLCRRQETTKADADHVRREALERLEELR